MFELAVQCLKLIDWVGLEFPYLNGIKTPTLPADKQKNSFIYELIEFVELVELDVYKCLNCFINSNCRDEQVGGIKRIPQNCNCSYCWIWTVWYLKCWKLVGWDYWIKLVGWYLILGL